MKNIRSRGQKGQPVRPVITPEAKARMRARMHVALDLLLDIPDTEPLTPAEGLALLTLFDVVLPGDETEPPKSGPRLTAKGGAA